MEAEALEPVRPRNPWLAGLLSLLGTGVGQVYNGQWRKGLGLFAAEWIVAVVLVFFWYDFAALLLCLSILLGFNLFVAGEAFASARRLRDYRLKPFNHWWVYLLCLAVSFGLGLVQEKGIGLWLFQTYTVPSGSMLPTIHVGDNFMVEILSPDAEVRRGDVVVFTRPGETRDFIKRVVGLPGETLEVRDGRTLINGLELEEPYAQFTGSGNPKRNFSPLVLGEGEYFVMGDNRDHSYDSRWWGPLGRGHIKGRARYVYWPAMGEETWMERMGAVLGNPEP